jgi:hypothetical protein
MQKLKHALDWIPFLLAVNDAGGHKINIMRLVETGIIAIVTAAIVNYSSIEKINLKLDLKFGFVDQSIDDIKKRMERLEHPHEP